MNRKKVIIIGLLTIVGIYVVGNYTNFVESMSYGWHTRGPGMFGGHMMMGGVMHLVFWLVLFFFLISALSRRRPAPAYSSDSAVEILKKQYAKGNISKAEFIEKMKYLNE